MYTLLNITAKMSAGKTITQAEHGISEMTEIMVRHHRLTWELYKKSGETKITLSAPEHTLKALYRKYADKSKEIWCIDVIDAGKTEVEEGTMTALVFCPMRRVDAPEEFAKLRLY